MYSLAKALMPGLSSAWVLPRSTGGLRTSILAALSAQDAGQARVSSCFFSNSTAGDSQFASDAQAGAQLPRPQLRFDDPEVAFRDKTTRELMRAMAIFSACRFKLLVANAKPLLRASRAVFGDTAMAALLRPTLFGHFCAGEDLKSMQPTVLRLRRAGIGGILDYVAEEEDPVEDPLERPCGWAKPATETPEDSALYERRVDKFIQSIQGSAEVQTDGFAALKVTGLAHPLLLRRLSRLLTEIRWLFGRFDLDGSGFISEQEFREVHEQLFTGVAPDFTFDVLDPKHEGRVDYISFTESLSPQEATRLVQRCREAGPLYAAVLTDDELLQVERLHDRVQRMAATAAALGVRLLVDAEKSTVQPAIDLVVNSAMRCVNTGAHPIVFNTYQCYLKESADVLRNDLQRARRQGYKLGAKLVRGAYKDWERARAKALGYASPIQDSKEGSDANYNACVRMILQEVPEQDVELVVASHNQSSVENAVAAMHHLGLDPQRSGIFFAQLYGMCDHLTYTLAKGGYRVYKLLPFGTVWEAMEYLLRRMEENTDALGGAAKDLDMNSRGLRQRMWQRRSSAAQAAAQHAHA